MGGGGGVEGGREKGREREGDTEMTLYRSKGTLTSTLSGICRRYCITPFASSQRHFTAWVLYLYNEKTIFTYKH